MGTDSWRPYPKVREHPLTTSFQTRSQVVPVGWSFNAELDAIEIGGHDCAQTKKFRDVQQCGRAALVIDDLASTDPWRPRGIEIRGRANAIQTPRALIRIHPERIVSWGSTPAVASPRAVA